MQAARILRQKIQSNQITTGALATFHFWPGMVEIAMKAGLDYLIIDLEHLTHSHELVAEACAIGRRCDYPILIRPPVAEFTAIRLAMDLGPCGMLVPYVESMETMKTIRDAVYMPPRGRRRPGGPGNYWVQSVNYEDWRRDVEADFIILPQIESQRGLNHVKEIAADELTTAIAVGPYDLSADLGVCWNPNDPRLQNALKQIRAAGAAVGKNMWMIGDGPTLVKAGFTFLCITEPTILMSTQLGVLNAAAKAGQGGAAAPGEMPLP